jgi:hypothetical protein
MDETKGPPLASLEVREPGLREFSEIDFWVAAWFLPNLAKVFNKFAHAEIKICFDFMQPQNLNSMFASCQPI